MYNVIFAILLTNAIPPFEVQTLDGQTLSGAPAELTAERLILTTDAGPVSLETEKLLTISSKRKLVSAPRSSRIVVELADGSVIQGRQYVSSGDQARITLADGVIVSAPVGMVRTVQLQQDSGPPASEWTRLIQRKLEADLLVVRAGDSLDYHKGVIHDVTEDSVRFDLDGEVLPVKRAKVYGFAYRHGVEAELPPAVCRITDASGSQWSALSLTLSETLKWTTPAGFSVSQPLAGIAQIDFSGGKLVYLSDVKPDSIDWTPYFGGGKALESMKQFYMPRFNRGFDSKPLKLGGVEFRKGLAMHGRTEIVYRLPNKFSRFRATAGIDDAVRPAGKVRLEVRGDGRVLLDAVISGSDAPLLIDLDIKDVRRLTILVDFGGGLNVGDRLLLCNARISK